LRKKIYVLDKIKLQPLNFRITRIRLQEPFFREQDRSEEPKQKMIYDGEDSDGIQTQWCSFATNHRVQVSDSILSNIHNSDEDTEKKPDLQIRLRCAKISLKTLKKCFLQQVNSISTLDV